MRRQLTRKMKVTNVASALILTVLVTCVGTGVTFGKDLPPVKIGAAGPFTGDLSKIGLDSLNAIQMAVDEANAEGGVNG
ncbi:MAG: ABC transporter substrate-binding protein, partial [Bacillota bacterium]